MRVSRLGCILFEEFDSARIGPPLVGEIECLGETGLPDHLCFWLNWFEHGVGLAEDVSPAVGVPKLLAGLE